MIRIDVNWTQICSTVLFLILEWEKNLLDKEENEQGEVWTIKIVL